MVHSSCSQNSGSKQTIYNQKRRVARWDTKQVDVIGRQSYKRLKNIDFHVRIKPSSNIYILLFFYQKYSMKYRDLVSVEKKKIIIIILVIAADAKASQQPSRQAWCSCTIL